MNYLCVKTDTNFTYARNAEHVTLHTNLLAEVPEEVAEAQGFATPRANYAAALTQEKDCFQTDLAYSETEEMQTRDKIRDKGLYWIANVIDAYADYSLDEELAAAAKRLQLVMKRARNAGQKPNAEETSILDDVYEKLQDEANAADIEALHLTDALAKAKEANDAYNALYVERTRTMNTRNVSANMKQLRPQTDEAFRQLALAINSYYMVNSLSTKDAEKEAALSKIINNMNGLLYQHDRTVRTRLGLGSKGKDDKPEPEPEPTPEPTPVTPEITAVYQKEGGDPENPNRIERGKQTGVKYQGFTLKGQDGTLEHVIGLVNDQDYIEWINPETITNVTDTSCEFTMVPDLTEGQYKVRIETYDGGSPLVVEYPEPITLW